MPKVSIILPVYNASEYIRTCLNSLISQTLKDIEIIAIDDCSTDDSLAILQEYASTHPNIKVFHNTQNRGQGATRNLGIQKSKGEYIGFVDSDDYIHPQMYEAMYQETILHHQPAIVTTGVIFVKGDEYANTDISYMIRHRGEPIDFTANPDSLYDESPAVWNKIFRRDTIENDKFLENCLWEDVAFSYSKLIEAGKIIRINHIDYFYRRQLEKGISGRAYHANPHHFDIFRVADEIEKETKKHNKYEDFKPQIKGIQIAACLERVEEIKYWDIPEEEKTALRQKMYEKILTKYGSLEEINKDQLSVKVSFGIIEEFQSFSERYLKQRKHG